MYVQERVSFVYAWLTYTVHVAEAKPHLLYVNELRCDHIYHSLRHHPSLRRHDALPADQTQRLPLHHPQRNPAPHQRVEYHLHCQLQNEMIAGYTNTDVTLYTTAYRPNADTTRVRRGGEHLHHRISTPLAYMHTYIQVHFCAKLVFQQ